MIKKGILVIMVLTLITSCRGSKVSKLDIPKLSAKKVIKRNHSVGFDKNNLKASLTFKYKGNTDLPNLNASLRIEKDSIIWLSVSKFGIPVAKIIIKENEIRFYEKLSKSYFIGNFDLINHWLGFQLDFKQIQNLFIGETLFDLNDNRYKVDIFDNSYRLKPKNNNILYEILFIINPTTFKLEKEQIKVLDEDQILTILYKDFNKINESLFPKGFIIQATDKNSNTIVDVNYRNVLFDTPLKFPFKIPNGYREIELK